MSERTVSAPSGFTKNRTTVVQRSTVPSATMRSSYSVRSSLPGLGFAPGTLSGISHDGVQGVRDARTREKKDMQELNERFANYIEKVRYLEAVNKQLEEQLAALSNRKQQDFQPIKDLYEAELAQSRKVIDETCKEKAEVEARNAGLQDEVDYLKKLVDTLQKQARDYQAKIDMLNTQCGEQEGDIGGLTRKVAAQEEELRKLQELMARQAEELRKLRADVDSETAAHIEADNRAQSFEEECEFLRALLDKMPKESQQVIKIKGLDPSEFWKGEMAKAIRDLTAEFDARIDGIRCDSEMKQQSLMRQLQSGAVKDNMELANLKEEVKKLRASANEKGSRLADLEARLAAMEAERNELARQLREMEHDLDQERLKHSEDVARLQAEMEACLEELKQITDAKLGLELEIACYRQLLEGEENRVGLKQIVEQAVGAQTRGGSTLSDIIQQSS